MPKCPKGKVVNPKTGRCVKRDGALGKKILAAKKSTKKTKTPARKAKKAQNQRIGQRSDSDLHHTKSGGLKRVSIRNNRGNFGNGTRNE